MSDVAWIVVLFIAAWAVFFGVALTGYKIGRRNLPLLRAYYRLIPLCALPVAVVALILYFSSTVGQKPASYGMASPSGSRPPSKDVEPKELSEKLQRAVDDVPLGELVFHYPEVMQLRTQELVNSRRI